MLQNNISGVSVEGNGRAVPSFDDVVEPDEVRLLYMYIVLLSSSHLILAGIWWNATRILGSSGNCFTPRYG